MKNIYTTVLYIGLFSAYAVPVLAYTEVSNSVTTEAHTGGGGEARASVDIHTEVNGKTVTDIDEEKTSVNGSVSIEKDVSYESDESAQVGASMHTSTNKETDIETEGDLSAAATTSVRGEAADETGDDQNFMVLLKTFFTTYVFWWL